MKKIEALLTEIAGNEALKAKFEEAFKTGKLDGFLKENDCDTTAETCIAFLKSLVPEDNGSLSLDEMDKVAGGLNQNLLISEIQVQVWEELWEKMKNIPVVT